jgi:hypothetical protein
VRDSSYAREANRLPRCSSILSGESYTGKMEDKGASLGSYSPTSTHFRRWVRSSGKNHRPRHRTSTAKVIVTRLRKKDSWPNSSIPGS